MDIVFCCGSDLSDRSNRLGCTAAGQQLSAMQLVTAVSGL